MRTLDTLYSRKIKGIKKSKDGTWCIMLDGDAMIKNHDTELSGPDIPKKMFGKIAFVTTIMEEERTTLVFHTPDHTEEWRVILNPTMYSVKLPDDEEESFPQRGVVFTSPVPPHPDERVAEGPTGEEEEEE